MSMTKTLQDGLKARECERTKLREPPPVPYIPVKDEVQEEVAKIRNMEIKTHIEKDTTLNFPVWQENRTREGFLMHVQAVLDAIKKRGHFDDYEKAASKFKEAREAIESAKAGLSLLEETVAKKAKEVKKKAKKEKAKEGDEVTLKAPAKAKKAKEGDEVTFKTPEKAAESTADVQEAQDAPETDDQLKANYLSELETAKKMHRVAKGVMAAAASKMFSFYSNLLSPESKYA